LAGKKHARIAQERETTRNEALFPRNKKVKILFDGFDRANWRLLPPTIKALSRAISTGAFANEISRPLSQGNG
jgi:hypothetical protein